MCSLGLSVVVLLWLHLHLFLWAEHRRHWQRHPQERYLPHKNRHRQCTVILCCLLTRFQTCTLAACTSSEILREQRGASSMFAGYHLSISLRGFQGAECSGKISYLYGIIFHWISVISGAALFRIRRIGHHEFQRWVCSQHHNSSTYNVGQQHSVWEQGKYCYRTIETGALHQWCSNWGMCTPGVLQGTPDGTWYFFT